MFYKHAFFLLLLLFMVMTVSAQDDATPTDIPDLPETIITALDAEGDYTLFLDLLANADPELYTLLATSAQVPRRGIEGLSGLSSDVVAYTVFAPTDDAFTAAELTLDDLLADEAAAAALVRYHVIPQALTTAQLTEQVGKVRQCSTLNAGTFLMDTPLTLSIDPEDEANTLYVDAATVIRGDIMAGNGIVHALDAPLIPQPLIVLDILAEADEEAALSALESADNFTHLLDWLAAIDQPDLDYLLNGAVPVTVFAQPDSTLNSLTESEWAQMRADPDNGRFALGFLIAPGAFSDAGLRAMSQTRSPHLLTATPWVATIAINSADDTLTFDAQPMVVAPFSAANAALYVVEGDIFPNAVFCMLAIGF